MASITLAGMQGDLYRQAHDLASRKRDEYINQTDLRKSRANAERTAIARTERGALKQDDLNAFNDLIKRDLTMLDIDPAAAQRVIDQTMPKGSKITDMKRDPNTGRIVTYTITLADGQVIQTKPSLIQIRAASEFQNAPQIGAAAATAEQAATAAQQAAAEKDLKLRQAAEETRTKAQDAVIAEIKKNRGFKEIQDPNGYEGDKIWVDRNNKQWTDKDQSIAMQQSADIAQGSAATHYETGVAPSTYSATQQYREQKLSEAKDTLNVMARLKENSEALKTDLERRIKVPSQFDPVNPAFIGEIKPHTSIVNPKAMGRPVLGATQSLPEQSFGSPLIRY